MKELTHGVLVEHAAAWLVRNKHRPVLTEARTRDHRECPDAIGWGDKGSTVIECKASRSDFLADRAKRHRNTPESMGTRRFWLAPAGLIGTDELSAGWGLLEVKGKRIQMVRPATKQLLDPRGLQAELRLLAAEVSLVQAVAKGRDLFPCRRLETLLAGVLANGPTVLDQMQKQRRYTEAVQTSKAKTREYYKQLMERK